MIIKLTDPGHSHLFGAQVWVGGGGAEFWVVLTVTHPRVEEHQAILKKSISPKSPRALGGARAGTRGCAGGRIGGCARTDGPRAVSTCWAAPAAVTHCLQKGIGTSIAMKLLVAGIF
ncbi:hypothetical protein CDAR_183581 [Caerostris darwini]|uniref:Uncharacterized protein n=1 Tax=Caerostris darwini TaxID=1538125 RepID=A0AAV4QXV6_9ARAC|nr:hypothetical protein CDAR_183581 [Caerostris darwini]